MDVWFLDENFNSRYVIDQFESLIWTERYNGAGNFEIYTPVNPTLLKIMDEVRLKQQQNIDSYAWMKNSDQVMIIDTEKTVTEIETGGYMIISGKSLEYMLDRRIIWVQTILDGNFQNQVKKLLEMNVINPEIEDRKIPNFYFEESTDERITKLEIRAQYTGDNLYDTLVSMCNLYHLGFRIRLTDDFKFAFGLYIGEDRSYDQNKNPYVIFSPKFENIIDSKYLESSSTARNVAKVDGEDEGNNRKTITVGSAKGLARRELYVDARDIQSQVGDTTLSADQYNSLLTQRGKEKLAENNYTKSFEGQIEATQIFKYDEDFFKGDIVQIVTEYGIEAKVRIMEFVRVQDTTGYSTYPTFDVIDDEEEEGGEET